MYVRGKNRIFYQTNDIDGDSIEIDILNPHLERTEKLPMIYVGENLYYIDIWFKYIGSYVIRTFKNGIKLGHGIINVGADSSPIIYPESDRLI